MFHVAISQTTTSRWDLPTDIDRFSAHGFHRLSLWRPKVSDIGAAATAGLLDSAGMRASSVQWAGGFTGGDGRSFADSVADALEAIDTAAAVGAPVLVIHSGCRGGHTRAHARRLLLEALEAIAPVALAAGVTLAVKPLHPAAAHGASFLTRPADALEAVESCGHPAVRLAIDLWQFGHDPEFFALLPRLTAVTAVVQVADRIAPPTAECERLPVGRGGLPLEWIAALLAVHGYDGEFEFDPVGEAVEAAGYERVLADTRRAADAWADRLARAAGTPASGRLGAFHVAAAADHRPEAAGQFRTAGSRRSHASSQTVSPG